MTAEQLIKELQAYPPDAHVWLQTYNKMIGIKAVEHHAITTIVKNTSDCSHEIWLLTFQPLCVIEKEDDR